MFFLILDSFIFLNIEDMHSMLMDLKKERGKKVEQLQ